jgi:hypothetical protein
MKDESAKHTPHATLGRYWKEYDIIAPICDPMVRSLAFLFGPLTNARFLKRHIP